jgi:hypothetical protein
LKIKKLRKLTFAAPMEFTAFARRFLNGTINYRTKMRLRTI